MDSVPSAASSVLPDVSQIQLSRRRIVTSPNIAAGGRPASAHQPYGSQVSSPVDAVLRNFRAVRQRSNSARLARHPRSMCASGSAQQADCASKQQGQAPVTNVQHWEPPASSTACNSFRHSLPPHSQRLTTGRSASQRPGTAYLSVSTAQRCNQAAQGRQSSFSKRAAYGDVLRRICTPQTSSMV